MFSPSSSKIVTVAVDGLNVTLDSESPWKDKFTMKDSVGSITSSLRMEMVIVSFGCAVLSVRVKSVVIVKSNPPVII